MELNIVHMTFLLAMLGRSLTVGHFTPNRNVPDILTELWQSEHNAEIWKAQSQKQHDTFQTNGLSNTDVIKYLQSMSKAEFSAMISGIPSVSPLCQKHVTYIYYELVLNQKMWALECKLNLILNTFKFIAIYKCVHTIITMITFNI